MVVTLQDVYDIYRKWLCVSDDKRIDLVLAVALTRQVEGTKLWLLIVANSGDWKSEQMAALDDGGLDTCVIKNFTSRTLVSGMHLAEDLAPKLKDKIMIIPEMAQLLNVHPNEKAQIWAQLRDLYDGVAAKMTGSGKNREYKDLNVTLIGGSTPAIDSQILIHQALGSRELIYRPPKQDQEGQEQIMNKVIDNEQNELLMRMELKEITQSFLNATKYRVQPIPPETIRYLKDISILLTYMRAPAEFDSYSGELINAAHPEMPTRVLKQLKRLYLALKSLDKEYPDQKAHAVILDVVKSSSFQNRLSVYQFLINNPQEWFSEYRIAQQLAMGRKSVLRELNVLWNMGLVKRNLLEEQNSWGKTIETVTWQLGKILPLFTYLNNNMYTYNLGYYRVLSSKNENIIRTFSEDTHSKSCKECQLKTDDLNDQGLCSLCREEDDDRSKKSRQAS